MAHFSLLYSFKKKIPSKLPLGLVRFKSKCWSIVFFGSDNYSLNSLQELHKLMERNRIQKLEVVVPNERTPVYKYAVSNGFKTHTWPPDLKESYDFGIIVSFGKLIPKRIIELSLLGIFNVHASLLPKYRGGMPIIHAIKNGEIVTGVTVTKIVHDKFDAGEIILQKPCCIDKNELMPSLQRKLARIAGECIVEVIITMPEILKSSVPQSDKDACYAPKLKKEAAVVNWYDMTALEIYNLHRALFGVYDLRTTWEGQPVKLICLSLNNFHFSPSVDELNEKLEPGSFIYDKKSKFLLVQCKDKSISICTIIYNLKMLKAVNFYTGYLHKIPKYLWKFGS